VKAVEATYEVGYNNVLRRKPSHNAKVAESWHEESRKEVEQHGAAENFEEKAGSTDSPSIGWFVLLFVESEEHGRRDQGRGPNHPAWPHKITSG
jgi:hypothetical protein